MGQYVWSKELGSENGVKYSVDVFKESNTEYRPILTANNEDGFDSGFSKRRSFVSEEAARDYFIDHEDEMKEEAKQDLQKAMAG